MNTNTNVSIVPAPSEAMIRDFLVLIALLVVVLLFGLYIYFIRTPMAEYFIGQPAVADKRRPQ